MPWSRDRKIVEAFAEHDFCSMWLGGMPGISSPSQKYKPKKPALKYKKPPVPSQKGTGIPAVPP